MFTLFKGLMSLGKFEEREYNSIEDLKRGGKSTR